MKRLWPLVMAVALAAVACGGGEDGGTGATGGDASPTSAQVDTGAFDAGFGTGDLPDGFPSELIPPSYSSGAILDVGGREVVVFRSDSSFDDALDHYTDVLGQGIVIEAGDRQAQWLDGPGWALALFGENPLEISLTRLDE